MYNFFKYQQTVRLQQDQRRSQQKYSQWLLKNQDKKQQAKEKQKQKLQEWVKQQLTNGNVPHVEDDHYKQWRFIKQFRDVEHQDNFLGYKTFRHKPSHEMNKYFNERERREIQHLGYRKQSLIDQALIHEHHRNRSLRSQGPLHPKISFRDKKQDHEYLNPRMKFKHVTDKDRLGEKKMPLDEKFRSVYSSFEMKKSKIGVPKISYFEGQLKGNRSRSTFARYDVDDRSEKLIDSAFHTARRPQVRNKIHFQANTNNIEENLAQSKHFPAANSSRQFTSKLPEFPQKEPRKRTYWKLAKTMETYGEKGIKNLLIQSQYDRTKDLSNLKMNMTCENHYKRPIL